MNSTTMDEEHNVILMGTNLTSGIVRLCVRGLLESKLYVVFCLNIQLFVTFIYGQSCVD